MLDLQELVNWCKPSPCKNGGFCRQSGTKYSCQCQTGWTGLYCDVPSVSCEVAAKQQGTFIKCSCASGLYATRISHMTSQILLLKVILFFQEWMWLDCAVTPASVWMPETHTIVTARLDTQAAIVRSR